jgi:hypothetical protein
MKKYEVCVLYSGQNNYIVEANSAEEAEEVARCRYGAGDNGESLGTEYEEIDRVAVKEDVK